MPAKKRKPADGAEYRFIGRTVEGSDKRHQLGQDALAMHIGQTVQVVEEVAAETQGAHSNDEDAIVVEWGQGNHVRRTSFGVADFAEWFEAN